jgi:hypothetical protein
MINIAYIIGSEGMTICIDNNVHNIGESHPNFTEILEKLNNKDYDGIEHLVDIPRTIEKFSQNRITVDGENVYYGDSKVHNVVVDRILEFSKKGYPSDSLVLFLENLLENPSKETIEELYLFMETGNMPITEDGCFLAYKKVTDEFKSFHACPDGSRLDHSIGKTVSMPRENVDSDRYRTCSNGLHFCSLSYLKQFYVNSGKVIVVKINPKDVCAIPSDYSNTKGRTCSYEVIAEYTAEDKHEKEAFEDSYVETNDAKKHLSVTVSDAEFDIEAPNYGTKSDGTPFYNYRDHSGRFSKNVSASYANRDANGRFTSVKKG